LPMPQGNDQASFQPGFDCWMETEGGWMPGEGHRQECWLVEDGINQLAEQKLVILTGPCCIKAINEHALRQGSLASFGIACAGRG